MLKRTLGFLLAAALLCTFVGVGASADATQDEAEARALLAQTMQDLREDYTLTYLITSLFGGEGSHQVAHSNGVWAIAGNNNSWLEKALFGAQNILLSDKDGMIVIYPDRRLYVHVSYVRLGGIVSLLEPREIDDETPIRVQRDGIALYVKILDKTEIGFQYEDSVLAYIRDPWGTYKIVSFSEEVEEGLFGTQGMRKLPAWIYEAVRFVGRYLLPF